MVLGFISLVLTVGQPYFSKICIPVRYSNMMLPCPPRNGGHEVRDEPVRGEEKEHHRRLLLNVPRILAAQSNEGCKQVSISSYRPFIVYLSFLERKKMARGREG